MEHTKISEKWGSSNKRKAILKHFLHIDLYIFSLHLYKIMCLILPVCAALLQRPNEVTGMKL